MLNANSVRHRILTAQDWLEKTPEKEVQETIKGWIRKADGTLDDVGSENSVCSLVGHYSGSID